MNVGPGKQPNGLNVGVPQGPANPSFYGGVSPGLARTAQMTRTPQATNPFDIIRQLGDAGALGDATQEEKNIYEQMLVQRETDKKVANMLSGITRQRELSPGFRTRIPSLLTAAPQNTLLTLLGNTDGQTNR